MAQHPDVLILGGGVIGLTAAYYLAREGIGVEVVDKGDFGREASWAGAGIIPPGNREKAKTPFDQLRALSSDLFPILSDELREPANVDNGYIAAGGLELIGSEDQSAVDEWRSEGIDVEEMDDAKLHWFLPALAPSIKRAYFLHEMAQIRNPRHLKALLAWLRYREARLRPGCPVFGFERQGEQITGVKTAAGTLHADKYLLAAGAWSESLLEQVGWRPGIRPIRGQIALLNTDVALDSRVLMHGSRYLVARPDGRVLAGSTEEDVGFDKRTTAEAIRDLLAFAVSIVPGLASAELERCWAGLRPGSPDGLPFLGQVPGCANLFVAAGHFRSGLQLSPGTGVLMKELLLGQKLTIPIEAFRLDRPITTPVRPAFRS